MGGKKTHKHVLWEKKSLGTRGVTVATSGKKKNDPENNREGEKWSGEKKMLGCNTFF